MNEKEKNLDEHEYDAPPLRDVIEESPLASSFGSLSMMHPYYGMIGGGQQQVEEGTSCVAGESLPKGSKIADKEAVIEALKQVYDPEIPVNIYDLGLIYEIDILENGDCHIVMTLTAPACPVAGEMPLQVANMAASVEHIGEATVTLTWEPAWHRDMMSEDAKMALDLW